MSVHGLEMNTVCFHLWENLVDEFGGQHLCHFYMYNGDFCLEVLIYMYVQNLMQWQTVVILHPWFVSSD